MASLAKNPLIGPDIDGLLRIGATATSKIKDDNEWWRLVVSPFLCAGAIHVWASGSMIWTFGFFLASALKPWQLLSIIVLSGAAGSTVSANIATVYVTAAGSAPAFGLLGGACAALLLHWQLFTNHIFTWVLLGFELLLNLFIGATPFVDNMANCAGFAAGALATLGFLLLERRGLNGSEWLLRLFSALCLCTSLVITVLAVLGLLLGLPAANCCNRVVCTPNRLWDCDASRLPEPCAFTYPTSKVLRMTCPQGMASFNFTASAYDSSELQDLCDQYCFA